MAFADRLRTLREKAGLTQYALAKASGLSKQSLNKLEAGQIAEPSWSTVQRLALALGLDFAAFVDPDLEVPEPMPRKRKGK